MYLGGLLEQVKSVPWFRATVGSPPVAGELLHITAIEPAKSLLLAAISGKADRPMLVVTALGKRAAQLAEELSIWLGEGARVAHLPEPDALFYEDIASDVRTRQARLRAMMALVESRQGRTVVVTSVRALLQRVVDPKAWEAALTVLRKGQRLNPTTLLAHWVTLGYRYEQLVEEPGTFARRGGIVDVFPATADQPVRLDLFGDELESIRLFDPITQRSGAEVESLVVGPALEVWQGALPSGVEAVRRIDLGGLREATQERWAREVSRLEAGGGSDFEPLAPCFAAASLLDYLIDGSIVVMDEASQLRMTAGTLLEQAEALRGELEARRELPASAPEPYVGWAELTTAAKRRLGIVELGWQSEPDDLGGAGCPAVSKPQGSEAEARRADLREFWQVPTVYGGRLKVALDDCARAVEAGTTVVVVSQQASRISELSRERDIIAPPVTDLKAPPGHGTLTIVHGGLPEGFGIKMEAEHQTTLLVLTDLEVFGWSKPSRVVRRRSAAREAFVSDLAVGDFVVHIEHGVGRFQGMVKMSADGTEREYLALEYADGDRLFVPSEHADRVNRYIGVGDHSPTMTRLGSSDWARTKARVKAAAREVAKDLLEIYAAREVKQGQAFSQDTVWQQEMEGAFPYIETADQLQAITEVKADMERPKPMDRLICGDVGYGKTEVALRAAFKAVMDGKQVGILVPTTVLAQQHYNTFRERMQAFPVKLEVLSRFRSDKEQRAVLAALREGAVDICIGTHRLLQKDVAFRDLGLVIIDEEQRFGVMHKEKLKKLRKEVDVLTLSATPIPRTLHMALVGLRDISTMETAPEERLPIKTYVTEYDEGLIREAVLRELERGGQVYFVHNRVQTIYQAARRLQELVPEANLAVGHGQLPEDQLEKVMVDFSAGKHDVLVCSTIIESGLDIPNVNTILVDRAEHLGLAQMYQLRGRVGRGANRAYAYFMFAKGRRLTPAGEKRLRTIFEATELGAGFRIAMKDLEIRGAGNLLGAEQHGQVAAVGFDLYCRLLAEAVDELQGKAVPARPEVRVDLPLDSHLPAVYVADDSLRLNLYQRLAALRSEEELSELVLELQDRFGRLPAPVINLAYLMQIKLLAARAGVVDLGMNGGEVVLRFARPEGIDRVGLSRRFGARLKLGHTVLRLEKGRGEQWMDELQGLLEMMTTAGAARAAAG